MSTNFTIHPEILFYDDKGSSSELFCKATIGNYTGKVRFDDRQFFLLNINFRSFPENNEVRDTLFKIKEMVDEKFSAWEHKLGPSTSPAEFYSRSAITEGNQLNLSFDFANSANTNILKPEDYALWKEPYNDVKEFLTSKGLYPTADQTTKTFSENEIKGSEAKQLELKNLLTDLGFTD